MSEYENLSADDKLLVDAQIYINLQLQEERGGFGSDPTLAAQNRETFIQNSQDYFVQPENLQRLRENAEQRTANLAEQGIEADAPYCHAPDVRAITDDVSQCR